jgi:hypothetical protein
MMTGSKQCAKRDDTKCASKMLRNVPAVSGDRNNGELHFNASTASRQLRKKSAAQKVA